jgi:hypothetical protein
MANDKTLIIILSETRASELTFTNFKENMLDRLSGCDLCVCIGQKDDYDYNNPFYTHSKHHFTIPEPEDFGTVFEDAYNELIRERPKVFDTLNEVNGLWKHMDTIIESISDTVPENVTYIGMRTDIPEDMDKEYGSIYDELVYFSNEVDDHMESCKGKVFGIKYTNFNEESICHPQQAYNCKGVITYRKPIYWRHFMKVKDQFMGGVLDSKEQHPGSAGILIYFRLFLLNMLRKSGIINNYDRFIITRSDYIYQLPYPDVSKMDPRSIWIPDEEWYGGYTDRNVILSRDDLEPYLNILHCFVNKSHEYYNEMIGTTNWNLEKVIKFHLVKNDVDSRVKTFPYVMYSVRTPNGSTRWSEGYYSHEHGYNIKYYFEHVKSSHYKNEYNARKQDAESNGNTFTIDDYYRSLNLYM